MSWRRVHRWPGLVAGLVLALLGITGALLALDATRDALHARPVAADLPVSVLVERVSATIPGIEEIRRLPSGDIVVYSFESDAARARLVDPADGHVLGAYQPSAASRWVRNVHRSFLLGDAGRVGAAGFALAMLALSASGCVLLVRRLGGWRRLGSRVRGSLVQRIHVATGRLVVAGLFLSSVTALYMSAATFGLVATGSDHEPAVASSLGASADLSADRLPLLQALRVATLRKVSAPSATDPQDTWKVVTDDGQGWIDRRSGATLAWERASTPQRIHDWVAVLHTGEAAWPWAIVLALAGASIPLFFGSGLVLWRQSARRRPRPEKNSALSQADVLIFVASEGGSTWRFAQALHRALVQRGRRVHTSGLEHFQAGGVAQQLFVLAATYGDGQAPAHAARALARIARGPAGAAKVAVLGFGDRQFAGFCAYAEAVRDALRVRGWQELLPLERIHRQSAQQFTRWGESVSSALGEPLAIDYVPWVPPTLPLELVARRDYCAGAEEPAVILRFAWPMRRWMDLLRGRALPRFVAGDLLAVVPPTSPVPRYYSLASSDRDGFVEICVRKVAGGICSGYLHALRPGDRIDAFVEANPGFALQETRRPVVLIGAGTGIAPLAGFIRANHRKTPMHLYFGARDPAVDFYFGPELRRWMREHRLMSLRTAFSRSPGGGGYVQDALRGDAARVRELVSDGAAVRVCGNRRMASGVIRALDAILERLDLSVRELRLRGRYAEDIF